MTDLSYVGRELDVFSKAVNWKRYWKQTILPYMGKTVLEVGAGIGGTTRVICNDSFDYWLGLEPDAAMFQYLQQGKLDGNFPACCNFQQGTIEDLGAEEHFDSILYIDVLEHIENDADEVCRAATHLNPSGHLIVLSPAYQWLYTPFDAAIGHYRRYTRRTLRMLRPPQCSLCTCFYLDSIGMLASLGNKLLLRASQPSEQQILFWDSALVGLSKKIDPLLFFQLGRSIIAVWKRD